MITAWEGELTLRLSFKTSFPGRRSGLQKWKRWLENISAGHYYWDLKKVKIENPEPKAPFDEQRV